MAKASSNNSNVQKALAAADDALGDLMFASGDQKASMPFARSAVRQFGAIFESDRGNTGKARDYAHSANRAGGKALSLSMFGEALSMFRTAETTIRPAASKPDSEVGPLLDLARTLSGLGETLEKTKQGPEARASYREAKQLLQQAAKKEKDNEDASEGLAEILLKTARMNRDAGDAGPAEKDNEQAVEILKKLVTLWVALGIQETSCGRIDASRGNRSGAEESRSRSGVLFGGAGNVEYVRAAGGIEAGSRDGN